MSTSQRGAKAKLEYVADHVVEEIELAAHTMLFGSEAVAAEPVGDHIYKVSFPFLGGSTVFENTLRQFKEQHPGEVVQHIYTVPAPLKLKKADALIFYIITEDRA